MILLLKYIGSNILLTNPYANTKENMTVIFPRPPPPPRNTYITLDPSYDPKNDTNTISTTHYNHPNHANDHNDLKSVNRLTQPPFNPSNS